MDDPSEIICPVCHLPVPKTAYFCPNCGKSLREKPPETTLSKEIWIYFVSLFLPPLGLWYVWKYFKHKDKTSRRICVVATVLTVVSMIVVVKITKDTIDYTVQSMNSLNGLLY